MKQKLESQNPTKLEIAGTEDQKKVAQIDIDSELQKLLESHKTKIKVFGAGGAGNNTISRLMQMGLKDVETFTVNTDAQDLLFAQSNNKILIGRNITSGLGAGSDPKVGENSARENQDEIKEFLVDTDLVFVTCGLGGGTGTGSAPVIAELARESGALTISIVTLPFSEEGVLRWNNAQFGLDGLRKNSDTLIVIQNDKLWEIAPEVPLDEAFKIADEILVNAVRGITELVTEKGLVNLDFADVRTIMQDGGTALIGMAESDSPERAVEAVERAIENPLIDLDINGAKNALLNITGGNDLTIKDAKVAMQTLAQKLDKSARIIWGSKIDPELEKKIRVMVIATGLRDFVTDKLFRGGALELGRRNKIKKNGDNKIKKVVPEKEVKKNIEETKIIEENKESSEDSKGEAKKIFREIMEEEADADLKILQDTMNDLYKKLDDQEKWNEMTKTCSALTGTAQMFDFYDIADLMTSLEDMLSQVIEKEFFVKEVLDFIKELPDQIRKLILNEPEAEKWQNSFNEKVQKVTAFLKKSSVVSVDAFQEKLVEVINLNSGKKENPNKEIKSDANNEESKIIENKESGDGKTKFSAVNDVVKYVDNLLRGENDPSKKKE